MKLNKIILNLQPDRSRKGTCPVVAAILNTDTVGSIRIGAGTKMSEVTEWVTLGPGEDYLNFFGPDIIIDNLLTTGQTTYELHSKSQKGTRLM